MIPYGTVMHKLRMAPRSWLVTGVAGFIGSNLLERLLQNGQTVVGVDNFSTGSWANLDDVKARVDEEAWRRFALIEGDVTDPSVCAKACGGAEYVLHQAALGSVPRSLDNPQATHRSNVDGFVNMIVAARDAKVRRFVYASSSSVYGDHPALPKVENQTGKPLSPYGVTKVVNELYADIFGRAYGLPSIGLRYFNVFGRRQDPDGPYAAVIPRWVSNLLQGRPCVIFGDGTTSRDFCYVDNAVQANVLAATCDALHAVNTVYNVAMETRTTLLDLYAMVRDRLTAFRPDLRGLEPQWGSFRPGDVRHSQADVSKARRLLGYAPSHTVAQGLDETIQWYADMVGTKTECPIGTVESR